MKGHKSYVFDIVFSTELKRLISASDDRTLGIWDSYSGNLITKILHPKTVWCCGLTPIGDIISGC